VGEQASALHGGEWSALPPGTHYVGSWVGLRAGVNAVEKRKSLAPARNRIPACQPIAGSPAKRSVWFQISRRQTKSSNPVLLGITGRQYQHTKLTLVNTQLRQFVTGFPPRRPGFVPRSGHVGFVVDKVTLGQVSPSTSVSPANSHSTDSSSIIRGWYNRPVSGLRTKWTQSHPTTRL
jgi:hypothetical protein